MALAACTGPAPDRGESVSDSVLVRMEQPGGPYPTAQIRGVLTLRSGCLLIDDAAVVWPAGTSWSEQNQQVSFGVACSTTLMR